MTVKEIQAMLIEAHVALDQLASAGHPGGDLLASVSEAIEHQAERLEWLVLKEDAATEEGSSPKL